MNENCRIISFLHNAIDIHSDTCRVRLWELLTPDVLGVKSIRHICTVFDEVFFRLGQFLPTFILAEAVAPTSNARSLYSQDEVVIVLSVEERHEPLLPGKAQVDEQILLVVPHRISQIHIVNCPSVAFKLMNDDTSEILVFHGIVRT